MAQIQKNNQPITATADEQILVVKCSTLFDGQTAWHGIKEVDFDAYIECIKEHKEFNPRSIMEEDTTYKQIIPYLVFTFDNKYFLMQRTAKSTETRLKNKFSLGIGGHIRAEDLTNDSIMDWARREFHEEVSYNDAFSFEPLGILNDDSNAVGQVHIGFVMLVKGTTGHISVKSELKSGQLLSLEECSAFGDQLESWSKFVVEFLQKRI